LGAETKKLPVDGEVFGVRGQTAFLMRPGSGPDEQTPWAWYAPTLPEYPGEEETWMFQRLLRAGVAVAGIDVGESYGSPAGRDLYSALYDHLVGVRGLSRKPSLLARSRGGLMLYGWAEDHPTCVCCIAGIYPVCSLASYPGLERAAEAYGLTPEALSGQQHLHDPVRRLEGLAEAGVPIYHLHGDSDAVVPLSANSGRLVERYRQLGGQATLNIVAGRGHDLWPGWFQCQELVDFVVANATGNRAQ